MKKIISIFVIFIIMFGNITCFSNNEIEDRLNTIMEYYEKGLYYEARAELERILSMNNLGEQKQIEMKVFCEKLSQIALNIEMIYEEFGVIKNYLNQGMYYEAKNKLAKLKESYTLGKTEERIWGEYDIDASLGIYKIENRNQVQRKALEDYIYRYFETTELRMQTNVEADIMSDWNFINSMQDLLCYEFVDVDNDGMDEIVVSSVPTSEKIEFPQRCFSIWDCDWNNNVYCIMAKGGGVSRYTYRYSVIKRNGINLLYESTGGGNSLGYVKERNTYKISNGTVFPYEKLYVSTFDELMHLNQVNGTYVSPEYAMKCIEDFDNSVVILAELKYE